ncbi:MAG: hypothetical protein PHD74_06565 [Candidatus Krumholzibacteria bacterium]|nr:hypothetical protein [Candidatus Krumholzibacteria bacterium]
MRRTVILLALLLALGSLAVAAAAEDKASAYTFKFTGYFKGDVVYDRDRVNTGNYATYVLDKSENDMMSMTARESRFGLDFSWAENDIRTDARFEFDFYGLGASSATNSQENKAAPMLRHAYMQLTKGHWSILAGQTGDIISPLVPKTANYTVLWDQGNIGYRRPQFRISTWAKATERLKVSAAVGAFRTLGGDLDADGVDDGADSAVPTVEGRVAIAGQCPNRSFEIGFSGHYGTEEYEVLGVTKDVDSWSGNADLKFTCHDKVELMGEFFVGENLGAYYGGVGQTVNSVKGEIGAMGGWGEISYKPVDRLWLSVGGGIDDPDDEDFVIAEGTTATKSFIDMNTSIFGNIMYNLTSTVTAMLEVSQLTTTYAYKTYIGDELKIDKDNDFDDTRIQFSLKAAIK